MGKGSTGFYCRGFEKFRRIAFLQILALTFVLISNTANGFGQDSCTAPPLADQLTIDGVLRQVPIESEEHRFLSDYFLEKDDGRLIPLDFCLLKPAEYHELNGLRVELDGAFIEDRIFRVSSASSLEGIPLEAAHVGIFAASGGPQVRSVAVILVRAPNSELGDFCSREAIEREMYGKSVNGKTTYNVNMFFKRASNNQLSITSDFNNDGKMDFFGPYTVPDSSQYYEIPALVKKMAEEQGTDLSPFDHLVYIVPASARLKASGRAFVGYPIGNPNGQGTSWIAGNSCDATIIAHELGHNLGLHHSNRDSKNNGETIEYGDKTCQMGSSGTAFNAIHQQNLGWLSSNSIHEVTEGGVFKLLPLDYKPPVGAGFQLLRIPIPDSSSFYYLSFRKNIFDTGGSRSKIDEEYLNGANLHRARGPDKSGKTHIIRNLNHEQPKFVDADKSISVQFLRSTAEFVEVSINFTEVVDSPPELTVDLPPNGSIVSGVLKIEATARDDDAIDNVIYLLDGKLEDWWIETSHYKNGEHHVEVRAYDNSGQFTKIERRLIFQNEIEDLTSPTITFISPTNGAHVSSPTIFEVQASDDTGVDLVNFYVGSRTIENFRNAPFRKTLDLRQPFHGTHYPPGWHAFTVLAQSRGRQTRKQILFKIGEFEPDTEPPTVKLFSAISNSPSGNRALDWKKTKFGQFRIVAKTTDNHAVAYIDYFIDGKSIGRTFTSSTSQLWVNSIPYPDGLYQVSATAVDTSGNKTTASVELEFKNGTPEKGEAPKLNAVPAQTLREGNTLSLTVSASDADSPSSSLTFSLGATKPEGANINGQSGAFSWTAQYQRGDQGSQTVEIPVIVTDDTGLSDSMNIAVQLINHSPHQNTSFPEDVNNDGRVSPRDVLFIINYLINPDNPFNLPLPAPGSLEYYYDVNGNDVVSPVDALTVINKLNSE